MGVRHPVQPLLDRWVNEIRIMIYLSAALVSLFLITSTNTYLAISGVFGLTTFLQMWLAGLTAMAATWTALHTLWVRHYLVAIQCACID